MYSWAVVPSKHQQKRGTSKESVLKNVTWKYIYLLFILEATKASSFAQPCSGLKLLSIILLTWAMPKTLPVFSWIVISWSLTHRIRNSGYVRSVSWFSSIYSASSYFFQLNCRPAPYWTRLLSVGCRPMLNPTVLLEVLSALWDKPVVLIWTVFINASNQHCPMVSNFNLRSLIRNCTLCRLC